MHLVTYSVHVVTGTNLTIHSNTGPAENQDIAIQSSQICLHVSQFEPSTQDYRLP